MSRPAPALIRQWMTISQVAKEAGVSRAMAYRWVADGKLAAQRYPGRGQSEVLRVDRRDFEAFVKAYRRVPDPL